jgi:hypothetical protein
MNIWANSKNRKIPVMSYGIYFTPEDGICFVMGSLIGLNHTTAVSKIHNTSLYHDLKY